MTPTPEPAPADKLSADRRRTERQRLLISRGQHPLGFLGVTRNPKTRGLSYERTDPAGRDFTCGSCKFRETSRPGARTIAKCVWTSDGKWFPRVTSSVASDVRAWWPACTKWVGIRRD